jgi:hypothetical protein
VKKRPFPGNGKCILLRRLHGGRCAALFSMEGDFNLHILDCGLRSWEGASITRAAMAQADRRDDAKSAEGRVHAAGT